MAESVTFWTAVASYAVATALFFVSLAFERHAVARRAVAVAGLGAVPHGVCLALRWIDVGHGPFSTRYEVLSANVFVLVLLFLVAQAWAPALRALGAFVLPIALLMLGWAVDTFGVRNEVPIIFRSFWLYLHIGFAKAFGAAGLMAAAAAVGFLLKTGNPTRWKRLPAAERLELYAHQLLLVAFLFLGVMIVAGALWAHQSWGRYWAWDPIETSALCTWLAYGVTLHFRVLHGWRGRRMAWATLVAFALTVMTIYVVVLVVPTIHDFYMVGKP